MRSTVSAALSVSVIQLTSRAAVIEQFDSHV